MFDTHVTVVGNLVDDPVTRRTANGTMVVNFRVASTSRRKDRESGQWTDGDSLFLSVTCWRDVAGRVATALRRGDPVLVFGRLYSRSYTVGDQTRTAYEMEASAVGLNLARIEVVANRTTGSLTAYDVAGGDQQAPAGRGDDRGAGAAAFTEPDTVPVGAAVA